MDTIAALNERLGIKGALRIVAGAGRLPCVEIATSACTGRMYLHGGHVTDWTPAGQKPVLWMSEKSLHEAGKSIRGGVPVCFPWFGPGADGTRNPVHGFGRILPWELESTGLDVEGRVTLLMLLSSSAATRAQWPFDFELRHQVSFGGDRLQMTLETRNPGVDAFTIGKALHTYFAVSDVRKVRITGLQGADFIDRVEQGRMKRQEGAVQLSGETDRIYLSATETAIEDPGMGRGIRIAKQGSETTVVWNPWIEKAKAMADFGDDEWPSMLCVETCAAQPKQPVVAAGGRHVLTASISVHRL